jgi:ABC transport system ATP-binding/permease protein
MVTLDQRREALDPDATLAETLTGGGGDWVEVGGRRKHVVGYMKDFLFGPEQARTPVRVLSGGERNRLMLARALAQPSNLLVLDEPTNDLDLETLDLLQEMLGDYAGTVLLVSHDRDFLDRVVTSTLVAEGQGRWLEYAGGYSDMLAQRGRRAAGPPEAARSASAVRRQARPTPSSSKRKLSFNEQHALRELPDRIEKLRALIARLQETLSDAGLYRRDPALFEKASRALPEAQAELASAEDRWLQLELLREELEA